MAKAYSFTDLPQPTNLTATAVSDGSLTANTTYYYRVVGVYSNSTYAGTWQGKSLVSDEVSATTTTTNKSIQLQFTSALGACTAYRIFRATLSNGMLFQPCLNWTPLDATYNSSGTVTIVDDGKANFGNNYCDIENNPHGRLTLSGSTSSDPFSIVDLYNADVAAGWGIIKKLNFNTYLVNTYLVGHVGMYWNDSEKNIIFGDGFDFPDQTITNITFGKISGDNLTYAGCNIDITSCWLANAMFGTLTAYRTVFRYIYPSPYSSGLGLSTIYIRAGTVQDCQCDRFRGFIPNTSSVNIKNLTISRYDVAFNLGPGTYTNVRALYGSRLFQTTTSSVINCRGLYTDTNSTSVVYLIGANAQVTLIDTVYKNSLLARAASDSTGSWIKDQFSFNLTVYEDGGNTAINGASIKMYDNTDTLLVDTTTDSNGEITEQYITRIYATCTGTTITSTSMLPIKMVVSGSGYETYEEYLNPSDSSAIVKSISLKPIVPIRQTLDGELLLANQPETGSSAKLLKI